MNRKIVFFDGVCNFCNSTVDYIWNHNSSRDIHYASLQSDFSRNFFRSQGIDISDLNTIYFLEDGVVHQRSDAVIRISQNLDGCIRFWGKLLRIIPRFLRDFGYKVVSKYRYRLFGKSNTCRLPTQEEKERFL